MWLSKTRTQSTFRRLLKSCQYVSRVKVTDQLKSRHTARPGILPGIEHRKHYYLNNRAEHSHQPTIQWERRMPEFESAEHAQRLLAADMAPSPHTSDRNASGFPPLRTVKAWMLPPLPTTHGFGKLA